MAKTITKEQVANVVREAIPDLAVSLPKDIEQGLMTAFAAEDNPRAKEVLKLLTSNACVAREDCVPICQDTGSVWVCLEIGPDVVVSGDALDGVNEAVGKAYVDSKLRKSIVRDALFDRTNTNDNTPAFTEVKFVDEPGARIHIMLKGGGSDNASRVVMLAPGAAKQGIIDEVLKCVREKAANACPPLIVGVGVGATFDKVAGLAKHALMRPLDVQAKDERTRKFEKELLETINATGVGAGALGGSCTALGVRVETAPCHIAALPLAINMGCSAMRRGTYEL